MTTTKVTKRDVLTTIIDMFANGADIAEDFYPIIVEYAQKELTALNKKNEARKDTKVLDSLKALVMNVLTAQDKAITVSDIMKASPELVAAVNYSTAKVTAVLTALRNEGAIEREIIKRISYYKATAQDAEAE